MRSDIVTTILFDLFKSRICELLDFGNNYDKLVAFLLVLKLPVVCKGIESKSDDELCDINECDKVDCVSWLEEHDESFLDMRAVGLDLNKVFDSVYNLRDSVICGVITASGFEVVLNYEDSSVVYIDCNTMRISIKNLCMSVIDEVKLSLDKSHLDTADLDEELYREMIDRFEKLWTWRSGVLRLRSKVNDEKCFSITCIDSLSKDERKELVNIDSDFTQFSSLVLNNMK